MAQESTGSERTRGAAAWIITPPLRGEGVACLVLRCTHSRYENEITPHPARDQDSLQLAPIAALSGRRLIERAAQPLPFHFIIVIKSTHWT
ncbi:hypothetical protein GBA52_028736 [Prunus armeniaca]|nr:hypothetical protein GBA52_028736 [Prunus armeniaca]